MTGIDVLAVGAHPDDVEVGCGGVLALCTRSGMRVAIADLTGGELGTQGTPELREEEARRAADVLGVTTRVNLGLPDGGVGTDPATGAGLIQADVAVQKLALITNHAPVIGVEDLVGGVTEPMPVGWEGDRLVVREHAHTAG